jgi:hypothetical protein
MREIDTKISPLVENMFPSFYQEDGENFVMFVKAYYEWLEENHQLIGLEDNTNFNVGDTIRQENVTGTLIAYVGTDILVRVDGLETFKCFNVCSELIPITSSSGGNTFILRGGTAKRVGPLFMSRNLLKLRDIDKTIDLFVVRFKEKYLKNIEFDIETNKQLLVKHSLDLYRSKGTERSIDLFFRLVYGTTASVYTPGEDVFRLSDGEWVKPKYIEITAGSVERAITLVGQQITGVTSGATAFVEKYVKRKIKNGFVHILYVSNISGTFVNRELLISDKIYEDSPSIVGSLSAVEIVSGSRFFNVGDIVNFNSDRGDYGIARVAAISNRTGVVDFILVDGGYGYTDSADPSYSESELEKRTQSIVSEKVLTLTNVVTSNTIDSIVVAAGGSGYDNTDLIAVTSPFSNATGVITTNSSGGITAVTITNPGSGFYTLNPTVNVTNSTGGATLGTAANLVATTKEQDRYFQYFESLTQPIVEVEYDTASNNQAFIAGQQVYIGNSTVNNAFGTIISNANGDSSNGILTISIANNGQFGTSNTITLTTNTSVTANVAAITNTSATGTLMGVPNSAVLTVSSLVGTIDRGDEVFQLDINGAETGNAAVVATFLGTTSGSIDIANLRGVLRQNRTLRVRNKTTTANLAQIQLTVGLYNISNNYTNNFSASIFSTNTGTTANVLTVSAGSGASFRVGTISETEIIYLNTDLLNSNNDPTVGANQAYMTLPINATEYGFPKNPTGNSEAIIFSCLNFDSFNIGTIASLTSINPGADYNIDPYVLAQQPYISGFNYKDYVITIDTNTAVGTFLQDERIVQSNTTLTRFDLVVSDETGYTIGEKVYQGTIGSETATGIIESITISTNTIKVRDVTGTFQTSTVLKSYIDGGLSATVSSVTLASETITAKGIVKQANTSTIFVKRIQFENYFEVGETLTGSLSGATGVIISVTEDANTLPIGLNAQIQGDVVTANGSVTSLQILDSGAGYTNSEIMLYTSEDGLRSGEAKAIVSGIGTGSGYYKTSKGFLSSLSKVHDGDFYQEYSYEILSRIPLDKYAAMFKKVMHVAGTRFFGGVLLENLQNVDVDYATSNSATSLVEVQQFNTNTDIVSEAIVFDNDYANNMLKFVNGDKVSYFTAASNTAVVPLANNGIYYIANANTTSVKLVTNPRALQYSFNANTDIASNFITLTRHSLANNDVVKYTTADGNTSISGLANNSIYHVVQANTSGVKLSTTRGGSAVAITASSLNENGHTLAITTINIQSNTTASGAATNGHFIAHVNEI